MMTFRTAADICPVDHQQKFSCFFAFYRVPKIRGQAKNADMCQVLCFDTVRQKAAETDTVKPFGKHMDQEAPDEFFAGENQFFLPVSVGVIGVTDHNLTIRDL